MREGNELFADDEPASEETEKQPAPDGDWLSDLILRRTRMHLGRIERKQGDPNEHLAALLKEVILELDLIRRELRRGSGS